MRIAKKFTSKLDEIKDSIEQAHMYFQKNMDRYHEFMGFVFYTSLTDADKNKLALLNKPPLEFNILEAMISRLRGEFAMQEPSIIASVAPGVPISQLTPDLIQTLNVIEGYIRQIFCDATNDSLQYNLWSDILAGGFSVCRVYTDYINELSFEQNICVERVFDPTLTYFDPLARESHKGDGEYCGELFPMTADAFIAEYGEEAAKDIKYTRTLGEFSWSYRNQDQDIILVAYHYQKSKRKERIVKLSNGHVVLKKHYDELLELWESQGFIEQVPIVIEERETMIETIDRYTLNEKKILKHEKTDYKHLPLVFFDGNSVNIREAQDGPTVQLTRPYVYHALGIQKLKNFSGQTVAAEIENMVQHKFKVAIEAVPEQYQSAYSNVQQADVLFYNAFFQNNPQVPLPPPMEIDRTQTPPIVENTFLGSDRVTQTILGSYDSVMGTNEKDISGVAIKNGAIQTNAAATPYLMGYIKGLNRIAQIIIDLIPKYYVTPRTIPVMKSNGKRSYQMINMKPGQQQPMMPGQQQPDQMQQEQQPISMQYNPNHLQVTVEAGVSTAIQKQVALDQIIKMMQASPLFAEFMNANGLETLLDNMDIRGIDSLKEESVKFMQQLKAMQQEQAQNQGPDPLEAAAMIEADAKKEIEFGKLQQKQMQSEGDHAIQAAKVAIEKQKADTAFMQLMAQIENDKSKLLLEEEKVDAENARSAVETAMNIAKEHHEREAIGGKEI